MDTPGTGAESNSPGFNPAAITVTATDGKLLRLDELVSAVRMEEGAAKLLPHQWAEFRLSIHYCGRNCQPVATEPCRDGRDGSCSAGTSCRI